MSKLTKLERATTMALLGKLKHEANLKNIASEIKLKKRFIRPNTTMHSVQALLSNRYNYMQNCMNKLSAPNAITPLKIPFSETPSLAN